jgi:excisionase family DNA binding protein
MCPEFPGDVEVNNTDLIPGRDNTNEHPQVKGDAPMDGIEQSDTDEYLTRVEAAKAARVSTVTLDKYLRRPGAPKSLKMGRRVLIPRAEFMAWLKSQLKEAR